MRITSLLAVFALCGGGAFLVAQEKLSEPTEHYLGNKRFGLRYLVQEPAKPGPDGLRPLVLICGGFKDEVKALPEWFPFAEEGFVIVWTQPWVPPGSVDDLASARLFAKLPAALRQKFAIAGGGIHLVATKAAAKQAMSLALAKPWEFRSLTLLDVEPPNPIGATSRLRGRSLAWYDWSKRPELQHFTDLLEQYERHGVRPRYFAWPLEADPHLVVQRHLSALAAEMRPPGPAGEVAHALDRFHDAATKADEETYFALLPDDAIFLGTDATERWTGAEFKKFALPWFQRDSAWIYVPFERHVTMLGDDLAMFDELLDNEAYGECRGSGVMEKREGRWVLRQYNLSVPMPNALAKGFVQRIRQFAAGEQAERTTIVIVRHAEKRKDGGADPELTEEGKARAERLATMLVDLPVRAVYGTEYKRTQATVAPLARELKLEPRVAKAGDTKGLAKTLKSEFAGGAVVVAAHSNTIPLLLKALGVAGEFTIPDDDYTELFVVTVDDEGARHLRLHF